MSLKTIVKPLVPDVLVRLYRRRYERESIAKFQFNYGAPPDIKADIEEKYGHKSDLLEFFAYNKGPVVHKWHHYIPLYDRYFSPFRRRKTRLLEIGVSEGGSLQLWKQYFGDDAIIFGIDINPDCEKLNGLAAQVRIGSQADENFLASVVSEMGGVDIVLDDGSHKMQHVVATLECLFPHLSDGGLYIIEDLHTAYWHKFGGGYRANTNFFRVVMDVVDDIHHWYHSRRLKRGAIGNECVGIHIHDSFVVFEKNKVYKPVHSKVG